MASYLGMRVAACIKVFVIDDPARAPDRLLRPRHDLLDHGAGFAWGDEGAGAAQLALALLADHLRAVPDGEQIALELHQFFKRAVIAGLARDIWLISEEDLDFLTRQLGAERFLAEMAGPGIAA